MSLEVEIVQGTSRDFLFQARDSLLNVATTFLGSDTLVGTVFAGPGMPSLITPTVTWTDAPTAQFLVSFPDAATVGLDTASYGLQVRASRSGRTAVILDAILKVLPAPGTATARTVYCQYSDMLRYCKWLGNVSNDVFGTAGYLDERAEARAWLEDKIQLHYRVQSGAGLTTFGNCVFGMSTVRTGGYNKQLQDWLNAGYLMTDAPRRVIEITSKYAIGLVLQGQITSAAPKASVYAAKADYYLSEAREILIGFTAEVDINGDGYPEVKVPCGTVDTLYG